jgi:hypothetical protein
MIEDNIYVQKQLLSLNPATHIYTQQKVLEPRKRLKINQRMQVYLCHISLKNTNIMEISYIASEISS